MRLEGGDPFASDVDLDFEAPAEGGHLPGDAADDDLLGDDDLLDEPPAGGAYDGGGAGADYANDDEL